MRNERDGEVGLHGEHKTQALTKTMTRDTKLMSRHEESQSRGDKYKEKERKSRTETQREAEREHIIPSPFLLSGGWCVFRKVNP